MEPQQPLPPISLPSLLTDLIRVVNEIQRKNVTMINYYIYPSPVPTEISKYEPRLLLLRTRIVDFSQLSLPHVTAMIDDAPTLIASYLRPNLAQLEASSRGIQKLFIEHYDRGLEKTLPYHTIQDTLQYFDHALQDFMRKQMTNPQRQPAENHVPPYSSTSPSLCRGAVAFLNNRDHGKVSQVSPDDLLPQHRGRLADRGGVVLWWECPVCAFRHRYHVSNSAALNINQTDEIMVEDDVDSISFRSAWLVKCHIYHPRQPKPERRSPSPSRQQRASSPKSPSGPMFPEPVSPRAAANTSSSYFTRRPSAAAAPKRVSFTRRKSSSGGGPGPTSMTWTTTSTSTSARVINRSPSPADRARTQHQQPQSPTSPTKRSGNHKPKKPAPDPTGPHGLKFFCPFCIAQGKPMIGYNQHSSARHNHSDNDNNNSSDDDDDDDDDDDKDDKKVPPDQVTCFEDSKEFMEHVEDRHTHNRPVGMLLQRLKVAVGGETGPGPANQQGQSQQQGRWDLDFKS